VSATIERNDVRFGVAITFYAFIIVKDHRELQPGVR
jgi:hypothetical protein